MLYCFFHFRIWSATAPPQWFVSVTSHMIKLHWRKMESMWWWEYNAYKNTLTYCIFCLYKCAWSDLFFCLRTGHLMMELRPRVNWLMIGWVCWRRSSRRTLDAAWLFTVWLDWAGNAHTRNQVVINAHFFTLMCVYSCLQGSGPSGAGPDREWDEVWRCHTTHSTVRAYTWHDCIVKHIISISHFSQSLQNWN